MTVFESTWPTEQFPEQRTILLGEDGVSYRVVEGKLARVEQPDRTMMDGLKELEQDPAQHFLRQPFHAAVYEVDNKVVGSVRIHPSSFAPASPFDTFKAIEGYFTRGALAIPRLYLYPSGTCNSACGICQFRQLDRFSGQRRDKRFLGYRVIEKILDDLSSMRGDLKSVAVNVSGDGEPTQHPQIADILNRLKRDSFDVFLTTNLIVDDARILRAIVDSVAMTTASIKGLSEVAYDHYQGRHSGTTFARVMSALKALLESLNRCGRREQALVGVATLVLPENTESYREMTKRFIDLGVDYLYFNPVEPSYAAWGIEFSEVQKRATIDFFSELKSLDCGRTLIRYPGSFSFHETKRSLYFDARTRENTELCGSAMWSPTVIATDTIGKTGARVLSCRSSENFREPLFWYVDGKHFDEEKREGGGVDVEHSTTTGGDSSILAAALSERHAAVMEATRACSQCRLERHVKMFDRTISLMKRHEFKGRFLLAFRHEDLVARGRAITFEETV